MKTTPLVLGLVVLFGIGVASALVECEGAFLHERLGGRGEGRALVLFHPSRDAHFSDDLSLAFAEGDRAERVFAGALRETGASVIQTRAFWLWRPNGERRANESNRDTALALAKQLGLETGNSVVKSGARPNRAAPPAAIVE